MMLENEVGPVLNKNSDIDFYLSALKRDNSQLRMIEYSTYVRVLSFDKCILYRKTLEEELESPVLWPECLEAVMSSFKGRLNLKRDKAEWLYPRAEVGTGVKS